VPDDELFWIANEGIRVSALVESLRSRKLPDPMTQRLLDGLLATTTDPLTTYGSASPAPAAAGATAPLSPEADMAEIRFEFQGPVTIQVAAGATLPAALVPVVAPLAPVADTNGNGTVGEFEKSLRFDDHYDDRAKLGYDPNFLKGWK